MLLKDRTDVASPPPSAVVRWVAVLVVPVITVLVLALLAEGIVRLRQWNRHGTASSFASLYRTDERLGLRVLVPGLRVGNISINAAGFRGPEIMQPKPPGTFRIAFLGASTTFCAEVSSDAHVWPQLVAEELGRRFPGVKVDFVNGGVPGYSVDSSRRNLKHRVAALQPDLIVVYHATNDFSGEVRRMAMKSGLLADDAGKQPGWLEEHSLLWELATKNLRVMLAQRDAAQPSEHRLQVDAASLGAGFRDDLSALLSEAKATGALVAVATFSTRLRQEQSIEQQKKAAVSAFVYMPFMTLDGLLNGYARYNALIVEVARAEGALLIGGENSIPGDPVHFRDTVHFTDQGSRAMARRVVDALIADEQIGTRIGRAGR
jgi:lysophospholipase L1-like esterase